MQNALAQNALGGVALSRDFEQTADHTVSHRLDDWGVTSQKASGRVCLCAVVCTNIQHMVCCVCVGICVS